MPTLCYKVSTGERAVSLKLSFLKIAQILAENLGNICCQDLLQVAQSGHTVQTLISPFYVPFKVSLNERNKVQVRVEKQLAVRNTTFIFKKGSVLAMRTYLLSRESHHKKYGSRVRLFYCKKQQPQFSNIGHRIARFAKCTHCMCVCIERIHCVCVCREHSLTL